MEKEPSEDKVINIVVTDSTMTLHQPDGTKVPVQATTTDTFYASGRKDCHISLSAPLAVVGVQKEIS